MREEKKAWKLVDDHLEKNGKENCIMMCTKSCCYGGRRCGNAQFWHSSHKWCEKWEWNSWLYDAQKSSYSFVISLFWSCIRKNQTELLHLKMCFQRLKGTKRIDSSVKFYKLLFTSGRSCVTVCKNSAKFWKKTKQMVIFFL